MDFFNFVRKNKTKIKINKDKIKIVGGVKLK